MEGTRDQDKMREDAFNPDDPLFRVSRGMDGDLNEAEQAALGDELGASGELRSEAERMHAVDALVKRWGREAIELDWESHAELAIARAGEDDVGGFADEEKNGEGGESRHVNASGDELDGLLRRWQRLPASEFEDERFVTGVMARVGGEADVRAIRRGWGRVLRIGVPLAAAAAIVVALMPLLRMATAPDTVRVVVYGHSDVVEGGGSGAEMALTGSVRVVVAFAHSEPANWRPAEPAIGVGYVGSEVAGEAWSEAATEYLP